MLQRIFSTLVVLLTAVSFSFAASGPDMNEGLWEITTTMKMQGMNMPSHTHTQCITKDDLVPRSSQPGQECTISNYEVEGNTVSWSIRCSTQGGEMNGTGKITYRGDSFDGTMDMTMPGSGAEVVTHMSGRRIGDCK